MVTGKSADVSRREKIQGIVIAALQKRRISRCDRFSNAPATGRRFQILFHRRQPEKIRLWWAEIEFYSKLRRFMLRYLIYIFAMFILRIFAINRVHLYSNYRKKKKKRFHFLSALSSLLTSKYFTFEYFLIADYHSIHGWISEKVKIRIFDLWP